MEIDPEQLMNYLAPLSDLHAGLQSTYGRLPRGPSTVNYVAKPTARPLRPDASDDLGHRSAAETRLRWLDRAQSGRPGWLLNEGGRTGSAATLVRPRAGTPSGFPSGREQDRV
jgi:hypothetical protein